jgi:hypothetical protein
MNAGHICPIKYRFAILIWLALGGLSGRLLMISPVPRQAVLASTMRIMK